MIKSSVVSFCDIGVDSMGSVQGHVQGVVVVNIEVRSSPL